MLGTAKTVEVILVDFPTPILPKIIGELKREDLIELHLIISINKASVASNLGRGQNGHLTLTMTSEDYLTYMGYVFVLPHKPGNHPPTMATAQEQALGTKRSQQNKYLFRICTAVDGEVKKIS